MRVVQNSLISEFRATLFLFTFLYHRLEPMQRYSYYRTRQILRNPVSSFIFLRVSFARGVFDNTRESLRFLRSHDNVLRTHSSSNLK